MAILQKICLITDHSATELLDMFLIGPFQVHMYHHVLAAIFSPQQLEWQ